MRQSIPGFVLDREEYRGLVIARTLARLAADHQEAGKIIDLILDPAPDDLEIVKRCGQFTGYGSGGVILTGDLGGNCRGGHIHQRHARQVAFQPVATLGNRLGMGIHLPDILHPAGA